MLRLDRRILHQQETRPLCSQVLQQVVGFGDAQLFEIGFGGECLAEEGRLQLRRQLLLVAYDAVLFQAVLFRNRAAGTTQRDFPLDRGALAMEVDL